MSSAELKLLIHNLLDGVNDSSTLQAIYALLARSKQDDKSDWGKELPKAVRKKLEASIKQADDGLVISHEKVRAELKEKFPHLNI